MSRGDPRHPNPVPTDTCWMPNPGPTDPSPGLQQGEPSLTEPRPQALLCLPGVGLSDSGNCPDNGRFFTRPSSRNRSGTLSTSLGRRPKGTGAGRAPSKQLDLTPAKHRPQPRASEAQGPGAGLEVGHRGGCQPRPGWVRPDLDDGSCIWHRPCDLWDGRSALPEPSQVGCRPAWARTGQRGWHRP